MYTPTVTPPVTPAATPDGARIAPPAGAPTDRAPDQQPTRLAGFGALAFVAVVVLQNVVRGSSAPGNGATA